MAEIPEDIRKAAADVAASLPVVMNTARTIDVVTRASIADAIRKGE